jgi:molybdopterin molybdotransferase
VKIEIQLTHEPIPEKISPPPSAGANGASLEFRGIVRSEENSQTISALEYEAYPEMAEREIRRILESLAFKYPCLAVRIIHRLGIIPVGDTAIYVGIASAHRGESIAMLAEFMDRLKQDVPIWKRRAVSLTRPSATLSPLGGERAGMRGAFRSLDDALAEIHSRCPPLPAVRAPLAEAFGRVLRETVCASEDWPAFDRSTRDGYAMLQNDESETFQVVDTLHAADWKPRPLKPGEAVRVATGATLPCENLRVVMQENIERNGDEIHILRRESARNISFRGEDLRAGEPLLRAGAKLDAGALALLATAGNASPLVSPRLRVVHFTTGDEIVPPGQKPKPGQIRDSNSYLVRGLLRSFPCELQQRHLPENFETAKELVSTFNPQLSSADLLLVSGGASVGDKDFTRPLLEWLGFEIVFNRVNIRPGAPLIFGVADETSANRVAFGLPGNPLSHFVCFHLFVATALAKLVGEEPKRFMRGTTAAKLDDAPNPRETLWPARLDSQGLHPLAWASSGSVTCLAEANALIRVPGNRGSIETGAEVEFWPTTTE